MSSRTVGYAIAVSTMAIGCQGAESSTTDGHATTHEADAGRGQNQTDGTGEQTDGPGAGGSPSAGEEEPTARARPDPTQLAGASGSSPGATTAEGKAGTGAVETAREAGAGGATASDGTDGGDGTSQDGSSAGAASAGSDTGEAGGPNAPSCERSDQCETGMECCGAVCVNTNEDISNCGGCGLSCEGYACESGKCATDRCAPGWADCLDVGVCWADLNTNTENCGQCENACSPGNGCIQGECEDYPLVELAVGDGHACARRENGTVICWGDESLSSDTWLVDVDNPVQLSAGRDFTCARLEDGRVACWGQGGTDILGAPEVPNAHTPVFPDVSNVVDISVGEQHTCAVTADGHVVCWGEGFSIHLSASPPGSLPPTQVEGIDTALEVAAGQDSTLVLLQNGDVLAWGWSPSENAWVTTPTVVAQGAQRIFNGGREACLITGDDPRPVCWGNSAKSLGVGQDGPVLDPTPLLQLATADEISLSTFGGCAVQNGEAWCWGSGAIALLDDPSTIATEPQRIELTGVIDIGVGQNYACALVQGERAPMCWSPIGPVPGF